MCGSYICRLQLRNVSSWPLLKARIDVELNKNWTVIEQLSKLRDWLPNMVTNVHCLINCAASKTTHSIHRTNRLE